MKHKRFSDEQVIGVLKEHEAGAKVDDICRRHAISSATFYTWRKKYGGMEASDAKRLRELEADRAIEAPLMEWMAPAPGIAMCHIGCCHTNP